MGRSSASRARHLEIFDAIGAPADSHRRLQTRRRLAGSLLAQARWEEALAEYEAIGAALEGDPGVLEGTFGNDLGWPLSLLRVGRGEEAARLARKAADRAVRLMGPKHYNAAEAGAVLAMALAATGASLPRSRGRVKLPGPRQSNQVCPELGSGDSHHAPPAPV